MNISDAMNIAKRYPVPQGDKQYIKLPSIEVLHCWLILNNRRVVGWWDGFLVVEPITFNDKVDETEKAETL